MRNEDFSVGETVSSALLLERFLSDCQALAEESPDDPFSFTYVADTIAAIYYYREYSSIENFLSANGDQIDNERTEWVRYMWRTLDSMTEEQIANVIIESLTHLPVLEY
jgi:hypothetical protein